MAAEEFQLWWLTVKPDHAAVLACEDGNGETVLSKDIPFANFSLDEIEFYATNGTILLASGCRPAWRCHRATLSFVFGADGLPPSYRRLFLIFFCSSPL